MAQCRHPSRVCCAWGLFRIGGGSGQPLGHAEPGPSDSGRRRPFRIHQCSPAQEQRQHIYGERHRRCGQRCHARNQHYAGFARERGRFPGDDQSVVPAGNRTTGQRRRHRSRRSIKLQRFSIPDRADYRHGTGGHRRPHCHRKGRSLRLRSVQVPAGRQRRQLSSQSASDRNCRIRAND